MMYSPANQATVAVVLRRFAEWLEHESKEVRTDAANDINAVLDALLENDAFGTEGQTDPRGDRRS